jgi:hypothetical protein
MGTGGALGTGGIPGAGGAPGPVDSGAGGSTVVIDASSVGIDGSSVDTRVAVEVGGAEAGTVGPTRDEHLKIINATTSSVGLDVTGPIPPAYTSCK